jgi:hypothetical protein
MPTNRETVLAALHAQLQPLAALVLCAPGPAGKWSRERLPHRWTAQSCIQAKA